MRAICMVVLSTLISGIALACPDYSGTFSNIRTKKTLVVTQFKCSEFTLKDQDSPPQRFILDDSITVLKDTDSERAVVRAGWNHEKIRVEHFYRNKQTNQTKEIIETWYWHGEILRMGGFWFKNNQPMTNWSEYYQKISVKPSPVRKQQCGYTSDLFCSGGYYVGQSCELSNGSLGKCQLNGVFDSYAKTEGCDCH